MSSVSLFCAIKDTTSDSANTVHILEIVISSLYVSPASLIWSRFISIVLAIISKNRPVPAAHLSFITKFATAPFSSRRMTLLSCPPISMTVLTSGFKKCAPLAWHVISVILLSPSVIAVLPYPVVTIASISSL